MNFKVVLMWSVIMLLSISTVFTIAKSISPNMGFWNVVKYIVTTRSGLPMASLIVLSYLIASFADYLESFAEEFGKRIRKKSGKNKSRFPKFLGDFIWLRKGESKRL